MFISSFMEIITYPGKVSPAKIGVSVGVLLLALLVGPLLLSLISSSLIFYFLLGTLILCFVSIVAPFVRTEYRIEDNTLVYRSGLRWGKVPIHRIRTVAHGRMYLGVNASCAYSGLHLKFYWGNIFIAPADEDNFLADLLRVNPRIAVEE